MKYEIDSRKIEKGQVFVAIKGHTVDGHDYIEDAIKNGASKIIAEKEIEASVPVEVVKSSEEYLKEVLKNEYSEEINKLKIIGITGTNGKTTTAYLVYQLFNYLGKNTAYLGTMGFTYKDTFIGTDNTTPNILVMYKLLLKAIELGVECVVMEVSSHALAQERIYGLHLDIAAFTNLTEDHLDYHKTMESYLEEKLKIVDYLGENGKLVVNNDEKESVEFIKRYGSGVTLGYSDNSDYQVIDAKITPSNTDISFKYNGEMYQVNVNLTSKFNVYNYMTALAIAHEFGYDIKDIIKYTEDLVAPKGRCETIKINGAYAVIDYAHTPDAVLKVISAYNELKTNRVITIVGCGGDRDPIKRPIMGDIATRLSDYTILTSDNPRTEDPNNIMNDILKGVKSDNYEVIIDRREAIKKGVEMLEENDILLVLGKGHEDYQIIGHDKVHLDDAEEVRKYMKD